MPTRELRVGEGGEFQRSGVRIVSVQIRRRAALEDVDGFGKTALIDREIPEARSGKRRSPGVHLRQLLVRLGRFGQSPLPEQTQRQSLKRACTRFVDRTDFPLRRLEISRVIRPERQIAAIRHVVGQDLERLPRFRHRAAHVAQPYETYRALIVRHGIGGVATNHVAVLPHALLQVAGHPVVERAGRESLALGHAVEIAKGYLRVHLRVLKLPDVARVHRQALVPETKLRIELHGFQKLLSRLLVLALRLQFDPGCVVADHIHRTGGDAPHRKQLVGLRRLFAERLAHAGCQPRDRAKDLALVRRTSFRLCGDVAADWLSGPY